MITLPDSGVFICISNASTIRVQREAVGKNRRQPDAPGADELGGLLEWRKPEPGGSLQPDLLLGDDRRVERDLVLEERDLHDRAAEPHHLQRLQQRPRVPAASITTSASAPRLHRPAAWLPQR